MDILWNRETATVADVVGLLDHPPLADNTVLTTIKILEQKGHVRHKAIGRAFVYKALVEREEAQRSIVSHVVSRFFKNSCTYAPCSTTSATRRNVPTNYSAQRHAAHRRVVYFWTYTLAANSSFPGGADNGT